MKTYYCLERIVADTICDSVQLQCKDAEVKFGLSVCSDLNQVEQFVISGLRSAIARNAPRLYRIMELTVSDEGMIGRRSEAGRFDQNGHFVKAA